LTSTIYATPSAKPPDFNILVLLGFYKVDPSLRHAALTKNRQCLLKRHQRTPTLEFPRIAQHKPGRTRYNARLP
jgi:hypothetical protein